MDLKERITTIANMEEIDISKIIWDEVDFFLLQHSEHGGYEMQLAYDDEGVLDVMYLKCAASTAKHSKCLHQNPDTSAELNESIVYSRRKVHELEIQTEYRERNS